MVVSAERLRFPVTFTSSLREPAVQLANLNETRLAEQTEKIFMDNYAPTFVVVDEKYRLVSSGVKLIPISKYLRGTPNGVFWIWQRKG